jgi:tRNA(Ile)-lysidine synthase
MIEEIARTLQEEGRLTRSQPLLVAVSGGPDSLCLLDVLWRLGYPLVVAHLDHQLRAESADEASYVAALADELGLTFCLGREDVSTFSKEQGYSIEEAARILRYRFLFHQAVQYQAQAVVTGHTADDQVETVLMHLLRGTSLEGLRGMAYRSLPNPWSSEIPLVRPLLGTWRQEIYPYLHERRLKAVEDPTNLETRYYRNRLRNELLPILESDNPGFRRRLWQMANLIHQEVELLEEAASDAWDESIREESNAWIAFDFSTLKAQTPAIQRRLLRRALLRLRPGYGDLDYDTLQRACAFIQHPSRSQECDWTAGLRLKTDRRSLWVAGWETELPEETRQDWPQVMDRQITELKIPGKLALANGWQLEVEVVTDLPAAKSLASHNPDPFCAWLDGRSLVDHLQLRARRPADSLQPLGMHGHSIKISDLMINQKLPRHARAFWPVVVSGDQIVWIPGVRLADPYRLKEDSQAAIHLKLRRPEAF